jgi:restriction endonuclease S subunit
MGADFPVLVSNNVAVFRHFPHVAAALRLQPVFLAGLLRSDSYEPILERLYRQSAGTRSLSLKQLGKVAVPIPSQAVQSEFVTLFQSFEGFALASQRAVDAQREIVESGVTVLLQEVL